MTKRFFLAAILFSPFLAADEPAAPAPPPPVWSGKAEISYLSTSGNTSVQTFGGGLEVDYKKDVWSGLAKGAFVRSETDSVVKAESTAGELRGARALSPRLEVFAQGDYFRNTFAGIDSRYALLGGGAYSAVKSPEMELKLQGGVGYTRENRVTDSDRSFATAQAGILYKWKISKTSELSEEFAFIEDLKETGDWRVANTLSVSAAISTLLSLKASHVFNYLRQPPAGFGRTDTVTSLALVAKF